MEPAELDHEIEELEQRVERLRSLYEQYFLGIEKLEPLVARKDVDRRIWLLRREQIRNTRKRFRLQTIVQRYNTYQQYWMRITREIEAGTYRRHLIKAQKILETFNPLTNQARRRHRLLVAAAEDEEERQRGGADRPSTELPDLEFPEDDADAPSEDFARLDDLFTPSAPPVSAQAGEPRRPRRPRSPAARTPLTEMDLEFDAVGGVLQASIAPDRPDLSGASAPPAGELTTRSSPATAPDSVGPRSSPAVGDPGRSTVVLDRGAWLPAAPSRSAEVAEPPSSRDAEEARLRRDPSADASGAAFGVTPRAPLPGVPVGERRPGPLPPIRVGEVPTRGGLPTSAQRPPLAAPLPAGGPVVRGPLPPAAPLLPGAPVGSPGGTLVITSPQTAATGASPAAMAGSRPGTTLVISPGSAPTAGAGGSPPSLDPAPRGVAPFVGSLRPPPKPTHLIRPRPAPPGTEETEAPRASLGAPAPAPRVGGSPGAGSPPPARPAERVGAATAPGPFGSGSSPELSEERIRAIHASLIEAKRKTAEGSAVSVESLRKSLVATQARLRQQHGSHRSVDFEVVIRDGKAVLKPVVR